MVLDNFTFEELKATKYNMVLLAKLWQIYQIILCTVEMV